MNKGVSLPSISDIADSLQINYNLYKRIIALLKQPTTGGEENVVIHTACGIYHKQKDKASTHNVISVGECKYTVILKAKEVLISADFSSIVDTSVDNQAQAYICCLEEFVSILTNTTRIPFVLNNTDIHISDPVREAVRLRLAGLFEQWHDEFTIQRVMETAFNYHKSKSGSSLMNGLLFMGEQYTMFFAMKIRSIDWLLDHRHTSSVITLISPIVDITLTFNEGNDVVMMSRGEVKDNDVCEALVDVVITTMYKYLTIIKGVTVKGYTPPNEFSTIHGKMTNFISGLLLEDATYVYEIAGLETYRKSISRGTSVLSIKQMLNGIRSADWEDLADAVDTVRKSELAVSNKVELTSWRVTSCSAAREGEVSLTTNLASYGDEVASPVPIEANVSNSSYIKLVDLYLALQYFSKYRLAGSIKLNIVGFQPPVLFNNFTKII